MNPTTTSQPLLLLSPSLSSSPPPLEVQLLFSENGPEKGKRAISSTHPLCRRSKTLRNNIAFIQQQQHQQQQRSALSQDKQAADNVLQVQLGAQVNERMVHLLLTWCELLDSAKPNLPFRTEPESVQSHVLAADTEDAMYEQLLADQDVRERFFKSLTSQEMVTLAKIAHTLDCTSLILLCAATFRYMLEERVSSDDDFVALFLAPLPPPVPAPSSTAFSPV